MVTSHKRWGIRNVNIFKIFLFIISLLLLSPAFSYARRVTSLDLIGKAYSSGKIDYRDALNYRVRAVLSPETLPAVYRSKSPVKSGTPILIEARAKRNLLSEENKRLLARERTATITDLYGSSVTVLSYVSPDKHFRIHYISASGKIFLCPDLKPNKKTTPAHF